MLNNLAANRVIDGQLNTFSQTIVIGNSWWLVDLGRRIIFNKAAVYVRDGVCQRDGISEECCKFKVISYKIVRSSVA